MNSLSVQPTALIFDMDGLLLDTEGVYKRSWTVAAAALGGDLTDEIYLELIGITVADAEQVLARRFGEKFPLNDFRESARRGYEAIVSKEGIPLKPGVVELLDWACAAGMPCGVGTSTAAAEARERLAHHGLLDRFAALVGGDEVARGKPHPDIFLRVAELLDVPPARALVFEDAHSGVRAAVAGGIPVVLVPDLLPPTLEVLGHCAATFSTLIEVRDWLEALPRKS